jgi:WD40 repeat protein/serine/threonine protein kinase
MNNSERREVQIFNAALEKSSAAEQAVYLDEVCKGDQPLRKRVQTLLRAHAEAESFFRPMLLDDSEGATCSGEPGNSTQILGAVTERPGDTIGHYKLLQQIGEGGFGVVYMAQQQEPVKRRVALKIIKLGMNTRQVVARFEAERQALALMDHPNIAKVLDAGATETGRPYFVMELVHGIKITEYCDQNNLSTQERLDLLVQICRAVQHAHQKGVIHRDIKPSNILVTLHDGVPVPKIIDFGIAKATQAELTEQTVFTEFGQFLGTPVYMSPEQAEMSGLDIDTRSDIYSLGVVLYELLVGKTPFDPKELLQAGLDEMRRTIREREPVRPSTRLSTMLEGELTSTAKRRGAEAPKLIGALRGDLDWIVMKCLEKDRTRRYETANALGMDIERHLNNEPVVARPPTAAYKVQKFVRRNKVMVSAAALVATVLVLGVIISTWQAVRATRAERQAQVSAKKAKTAQANEAEQRQSAVDGQTSALRNLYVARMNLVQRFWEQTSVGQVGQVRRLLEETAAYPERGFEWYYWQRQVHLDLKTLRGHTAGVSSVAFSPNGQRILTGSDDKTAKVWDAATGNYLFTLTEHSSGITSVAFSADGQRIVTGSADQTAKVWDAATGNYLFTLRGHSNMVTSVAFSADGQRIVTGSADQTAKVWDAATGKCLFTLTGHSAAVRSVAFSPDGQRVVTGSEDKTAKVWDVVSRKVLYTFERHTAGVLSVAFSPDGQRIATVGYDGAKVFEAASGHELLTLRGHGRFIFSVAFSPDGQRIVTGSRDQMAKIWDAASGDAMFTLEGHSDDVTSVAFSPDGQRIATGSADKTVKIWDATCGQDPLNLKATNPWTGVPIFTPTSGGPRILLSHTAQISSVAYSPDGRRIVTGSFDRTAKVWDIASGKVLLTLEGHWDVITSVAFSPDGQRIVTGSEDGTPRVWDAMSGKHLLSLIEHSDRIKAVAFSPDGYRIVTGSDDATAKVWDSASGKLLFTLTGHSAAVRSVAFSQDGRSILTGCQDGTARIWDAASRKTLFTLTGHTDRIDSVAFSPNGQQVVTGSWDQTARVWDASSGQHLFTLMGHGSGITSVAFSRDGQRILTGAFDGTARVWEPVGGKELLTLKYGGVSWINSAVFSPDGQRIVTGHLDGTANVWEAASAEQMAAWVKEEQTATEHLATLERERTATPEREQVLRAQDPGAIKQWLVLAPIRYAVEPGPPFGSGAVALDREQIPQEAQLHPRAGERVEVDGRKRVRRPVRLDDYLLDFNILLGDKAFWSVAYAVCYIHSDVQLNGLLMKVGCDDESKVYLNGKQIYSRAQPQTYVADKDPVTNVELKAGLNVLVFKVVNEEEDWKGSVRFTDAAGQPVKGIRVTLNPDPANSAQAQDSREPAEASAK